MSFFFSSRRRHTRWNCDWSSDVCSSDLSTAAIWTSATLTQSRSKALSTIASSALGRAGPSYALIGSTAAQRSEEHTSELQSQFHLVCRLLLEKKNAHISDDPVDAFHEIL